MNNVKPRPLLADCPYCAGSGTDAAAWDHRCGHCNGRGRMARFMVEEILARRAENGRPGGGRAGLAADAGQDGPAEQDEEPADERGGGRDDDPNPPRPYHWRPAA